MQFIIALIFWLNGTHALSAELGHSSVIKKAECSERGVLITFDSEKEVKVRTSKKDKTICQELKISDDKKAAAWVIACSGLAINGNGEGKSNDGSLFQAICARLTAAIGGKTFDIEDQAAVIKKLSFQERTHRLKFYTAPMHGRGTYVLYDLDTKTRVLSCQEDDTSAKCGELVMQ